MLSSLIAPMIKLTTVFRKVQIFWEGHEILKKINNLFYATVYLVSSNYFFQIFVAFSEYMNLARFSYFLAWYMLKLKWKKFKNKYQGISAWYYREKGYLVEIRFKKSLASFLRVVVFIAVGPHSELVCTQYSGNRTIYPIIGIKSSLTTQ